MADYTDAELTELRAAIREEVRSELEASQRSQNGLASFLKTVGLHVLARMVANLTYSAWQRFKRLIGWT
jgi:hypothetical protein